MKAKKQLERSDSMTFWSGIDVAKATFEAARWGQESLQEMEVRSFARTKCDAASMLTWLRGEAPEGSRLGVVMEATGSFSEELAGWLLELDPTLCVAIVNPTQTSAFLRSLGLRNKTDGLDAKALARYGHDRQPMAWEKPAPEMSILKDLVRTRGDLVDTLTAMRLRLKDHDRSSKVAIRALKSVIKALEQQVEALEKGTRAHLDRHEALARQAKRLQSIAGVGFITAVTTMVELGDLRRFTRSRQLTAFAGVSPRRKESGTSVRGKAHLCKQGSSRVRAVLYMASCAAVRFNPDLRLFYERLRAKGKLPMAALGAVMRKLLVLMRAVLQADRDWVPMTPAA